MAGTRIKKTFSGLAAAVAILFAVGALAASFFHNDRILLFIAGLRFSPLNEIMLFITKEGLVAVIALAAFAMLLKKRYVEFTLILLAIILGLESGYLLKKILQIPRPFATEELSAIALKYTTGYSFPSLHAVFCFTVIPFLRRGFKSRATQIALGTAFFMVAASRAYLGLHYLSDLIAGGLIGYASARFWLYMDVKWSVGTRLVNQIRTNLELRRQIAHALAGIALIFLIKAGLMTTTILAAILVAGTALVIAASSRRVPVIHRVLGLFERGSDMRLFPGKGAFFFVLGSLLALLIFDRQIALAGIAIMAVGDAVTTVVGIYFGRFKNPFNPVKHLEGTMLAIIISTLAAFTFVDFHMAFSGAVAGILVESLAVKFFGSIIDDNLLIPLVAGVVMTALA